MDLRSFTVAFCDSGAALRSVTEEGLAGDVHILTASPFLQMALGARAAFLRDRMSTKTLAEVQGIRPELQRRALQAARATPEIRDYGEIAALTLLTSLDFFILAGCLTRADCEEPRLIIRVNTGNAQADQVFNGPWAALLADTRSANVKDFTVRAEGFDPASWAAPRGLLDRLRVGTWRRAAFRAILALGALWPARTGHEALVLSENELLQETAFSLALRGWGLRRIHLPAKRADLGAPETTALAALCREVLAPYCERWIVQPVHERLIAFITERLLSAARVQKCAAVNFEQLLGSLPPRQCRVLLSNHPAKSAILGAWHVARRHGIPLFGFQHGVSVEMCDTQDAAFMSKEVVCSDRAYSFNERAAAVANSIADRQGVSVPVGMPGDLRRMKAARIPFRKRLAPIVFVSTAVYCGYWGRTLYGTRNDGGMLAFELHMIRDVLAGLQHQVLYKRYPALRLLDPDPAAAAAEAVPNIRVYSDSVDMRYLMGGCEVLVTARATSTLSWCLMSDKPLVFVDIDDDMRLRDDARPAFEKGLFLFSTAQPGWEARLRAFLNRPIADIQREWQNKAEARRDLVRRYFDMGGPAGSRAAKDIADFAGVEKSGNRTVAAAS